MQLSIRKCLLAALIVMSLASIGFGQRTDATFAGVVTDPTGAVLPGAEIQMVNEGTAAVTQQLTSETGEFRFDFVPAGTYTLKIVMQGFKSFESRSIPLGAAQNVRRTYVLEVGSITDNVTVTGEAPMVNTLSPEQRLGMEALEVKNLPMINRNVTNILDVGVGLTRGENTTVGMGGTRFRLNGLGGSAMSVTANGTDANGNASSPTIGGFGGFNKIDVMSAEAVAEVQVVKGVMSAEYGAAMGGSMSMITKSGTNQWHGSLFHRYEGSILSARQPFLTREANSVWNQYGGSLGGPVKRDKLFFFFAYEGYTQRTTIALPDPPAVPTPYFRSILLSSLPFKETATFLSYHPLPNQPYGPTDLLARWVGPGPKENDDDHVDWKVDYMVGGGNLSVSFAGGRPYQLQGAAQPLNPQLTFGGNKRYSATYVIGKGAWTSSSRFGLNQQFGERIDKIWFEKDPNKPESTPGGRLLPAIGFSGMTAMQRENKTWGLFPSFVFEQQVSMFRGAHSWKFGGILSLPRGGQPDTTALQATYTTLDDILRNEPASIGYGANKHPFKWIMKNFGFFAQDDWRVSQKLVLNLGVRYDRFGHFVAVPFPADTYEDFGRSLGHYVLTDAINPQLPLPMAIANFDGLIDPAKYLWGPLRDPLNAMDSDNLSISPRFGFAYTADSRGDFVVRGGFGVNFTAFDASSVEENVARLPYLPNSQTFTRAEAIARGIRYPLYEEDLTKMIIAENPQKLPRVGKRWNPDQHPPYAMNYTLGFQKALTSTMVLETGFVGTRGVKFTMSRTYNRVDRITGIRPNPNDIQGAYDDGSQQTNYNSLQTSLRQRMTRGLMFQLHHTWGKAMSYTGGDISPGFIGDTRGGIDDFENVKIERSLSTGDITHLVVSDVVYDVPTLFGNSAIGRQVLGGWQVSGIFKARTGPPLGGRGLSILQTGGRPDILDIKGAVNKECCSYGNLQYLNAAAFRLVPVNRASNLTERRGDANPAALRAPGIWNVDLSFGKTFSITEGTDLELKADMQNALNHTQYTAVQNNLSSVDFGKAVGAAQARVVQVQLRLAF